MRILATLVIIIYFVISSLYTYSVEQCLIQTRESLRLTDRMHWNTIQRLSELENKIN